MILQRQESLRWQASPYLPDVTYKLLGSWIVKGFLCQALLGYFFYKNWWTLVWLFPITIGLVFVQWKAWKKQVLLDLEQAFKDWLFYLKGGLSAGQSIERAIIKNKDSFLGSIRINHPFRRGVEQIYRGLELHIPLEECIRKMSVETGVEAMEDFVIVFQIAKKQGGRMTSILEKTIQQIYDKIDLRQEIYAMIAAKKMEQRIMCIMPFGILFFVGMASGGYFQPLYHNLQGRCIMTICMFVYLFGVWWGERLTEVWI